MGQSICLDICAIIVWYNPLVARKTEKQPEKESVSFVANIKEETKHGVLAIIFFALALFFILAWLNYAGLAGRMIHQALSRVVGIGFFLFPLITVLFGVSFLKSIRPNFVKSRLVGGLVFFLALLGIIGVVTTDNGGGGWAGKAISVVFLKIFDFYISLIFLAAIGLAGFLVMFDTRFSLERSFFGWNPFRKKSEMAPGEIPQGLTTPLPLPEVVETKVPEPAPAEKNERTNGNVEEKQAGLSKEINWGRARKQQAFSPPPLSLLENDRGKPAGGDIKANANIIKRTLANFGIVVEMDEVTIGPSITRYALKPAEGVKLSRILALQNDLSLALAAHPIRIEAPIPGKSLVGIEIPNSSKATVGLASLVGSQEFIESPHPLLVSLGRGITGAGQFANLAKSPHILIAGATGSGKSVVIHTFITSLLYRNPPDLLRFLMIDPKRVELTVYNQIPHLLTPVVTEAKKAIMVLRWAIKEMERRYQVLEKSQVRDIGSYHRGLAEGEIKPAEGSEAEKMPYIVIIIDELADIMSSFPRELEAAIVRLAQMSRAVGIHLVLSTQRPSVEVITGIIKANVPSRLALQVASQIDSRTIIDMAGAEKLLGAGDLLYLGGEMSKPLRLQSAFISESEVKKVVSYLAKKYEEELGEDLLLADAEKENQNGGVAIDLTAGEDEESDPLYAQAVETIRQSGKASTTYLQRKLGVGYARAARLMDLLEERGVVGRGEGAKAREIYLAESPTTPENNNNDAS